ncbi:MAG: PAS domain S-box protein, partial [Desulfobulbaceae bacterium]|nr:PAS domain S-box protein [Desulfobulbaceae bacterium]
EPYWTARRVSVFWVGLLALTVISLTTWRYLSLLRLKRALKAAFEERKQAEEALLKKTEELDGYFTNALDLFCIADSDGYFHRANKEWQTTLGYKIEELEGRRFLDFIHPDDIKLTLEAFSMLKAQKKILNFVNRYRCKDGSYRWLEWRATPAGNLNYAAARDITERKLAELEYETILRTAMDGFYVVDTQEHILDANDSYCSLIGYSLDELRNMRLKDIEEAETQEMIAQRMRRILEVGWDRFETRHKCKDGRIVEIEASVNYMKEGTGRFFVFMRDITERKRAEEELTRYREHLENMVQERTVNLEKAQEALANIVEDLNLKSEELEKTNIQLKEIDQLKSMFIASMSHELRTPLNSVIGFSSVLMNEWPGPVNAEQRKLLETILHSGKHLLALINDVIDVSKIEAGSLDINVEDFDLDKVIHETTEIIKKELTDKKLDLKVGTLHLMMHSDKRRLMQCVLNLLSNAIKFTIKGDIRIETRMSGGFVEISVADTGIGILEEDIPKLCKSFVRLDSPLRTTTLGTGLGLYITKKLITETLHGEIRIESTCGVGSTFTLRAPIHIS